MPRDLATILEGADRNRVIHEHLQWIESHGGRLRTAVESETHVINADAPILVWFERHCRVLAAQRHSHERNRRSTRKRMAA